jgi:hypothetical protein
MKGTDTIHTEKILLQQVEDQCLTYHYKGQNDDEPVSFILTDEMKRNLFFENRKHNYTKNQLHADFKRQSE